MPLSTAQLPHETLLRELLTDPAAGLATSCWADPADATIFALSGGDTETRVRAGDEGYSVTMRGRRGERRATFLADAAEDVERYLLIANLHGIGNRAHGTIDPWLVDAFYRPRGGVRRRYDDERQAWAVIAEDGRGMVVRDADDAHIASMALAECSGTPVADLAQILSGPEPEAARQPTASEAPRRWTQDEFSDELAAFGRRVGFPVERQADGVHLFQWAPGADVRRLLPEKPPRFTYRLRLLSKDRVELLGSAAIGFRGDEQKRRLGFDPQALLMPLGQYVKASGWSVKDPIWARGLRALIPKR